MNTAEIWHRRMGHFHYNGIQNMIKADSAKNLIIKGEIKDKICETCIEAKATRASCKETNTTTKQILERIHMDVWGPSKITSVGRKKYFLSIIDDFSRKSWVYAIARKDQVFEKFKIFQASVERMTGKKLKIIRTDQGLEFCSNKFEKYLIDQGIKIERTSTYTPQQNGVAERFNRTILERVRAMLFDAGMSAGFWVEALLAATHIYNRTGHSSINNKTPNEKFTGEKPSLNHLKIYGSRAYLVLPKQKRKSKLSSITKLGYFIGYAIKTKGYRVWIPSENRVEESIHVRFDESENYKMDKLNKNVKIKSSIGKELENETRDPWLDSDEDLIDNVDSENRDIKSNEKGTNSKGNSDDEEFKTPEKQSNTSVKPGLANPAR